MNAQEREFVVVSVGGSLLVPDQVDATFISTFRRLILDLVARGFSFAIVTGGGKTCRRYQAAAKEVAQVSQNDLDWIGINVNCMHAEFLRILFGSKAAPAIVTDFSKPIPTEFPIIMVGAEAPGHSSDFDAVLMARLTGAKRIVNLSNIEYVYDSDPRKNPDAKKFEKINWTDFRKLIPSEWDPGLSSPFDPIASKLAEELGLEVAVISGTHLDAFSNYLEDKSFIGTIIS
jgi:uridylate kinase